MTMTHPSQKEREKERGRRVKNEKGFFGLMERDAEKGGTSWGRGGKESNEETMQTSGARVGFFFPFGGGYFGFIVQTTVFFGFFSKKFKLKEKKNN